MTEDRTKQPERVFRVLRRRPTPELDTLRLWHRLQPGLEPRPMSWWQRSASLLGLGTPARSWRLAAATLGAIALAVGGWFWMAAVPAAGGKAGIALSGPAPTGTIAATAPDRRPDERDEQLTALLGQATPTDRKLRLQVRLVRGFDGQPPAEALEQAFSGAGGASALADLRPILTATFPYTGYALVGAWSGEPETGPGTIELSPSHRLAFIAERAEDGTLRLREVRLEGESEPLVADELLLAPGGPYVFGVRPKSESGPAASLVLAIVVHADPDPAPPTTPPVRR